MLVNRSLNEFLRSHERVAHLDQSGSGTVEYVPRAALKAPPPHQTPAHRIPSIRWSLAIAALIGWVLARLYSSLP